MDKGIGSQCDILSKGWSDLVLDLIFDCFLLIPSGSVKTWVEIQGKSEKHEDQSGATEVKEKGS